MHTRQAASDEYTRARSHQCPKIQRTGDKYSGLDCDNGLACPGVRQEALELPGPEAQQQRYAGMGGRVSDGNNERVRRRSRSRRRCKNERSTAGTQ